MMRPRSTIEDSKMEALLQKIEELRCALDSKSQQKRPLLVGIAGVPGAGKTTLALQLVDRLNALHHSATTESSSSSSVPYAVNVPMDGFHLPRSTLAAMPDPDFAAERRGAFWTFDDAKLFAFLSSLKKNTEQQQNEGKEDDGSSPISDVLAYAPSFDHAKKDPIENDILVRRGTQVLITEGNYLALRNAPPTPRHRDEEQHLLLPSSSDGGGGDSEQDGEDATTGRKWNQIPSLFDLLVFVEVSSLGESTERLAQRHMAVWNVERSVAMARASGSDYLNAQLIEQTKGNAQIVVSSVSWQSKT